MSICPYLLEVHQLLHHIRCAYWYLFYSVFILEMPINDRDPMILVYEGRDGGSAYGVANGWGVTETLFLVGVVVEVPSVVSVSGLLDCLYW